MKIPRWPFDKFAHGDRRITTQMKATGEVMAIDRTFESALMKAIRGLGSQAERSYAHPKMQALARRVDLKASIRKPTDERLWAVAEGLRRGWGVTGGQPAHQVDPWFLNKIVNLLAVERQAH